jgi:hypothetical protein
MVLVNLDDHCSTRKFEREGIFLEAGDLVIFTGSQESDVGQQWIDPSEFGNYGMDPAVAYVIDDYTIPSEVDDSEEKIIVVEA